MGGLLNSDITVLATAEGEAHLAPWAIYAYAGVIFLVLALLIAVARLGMTGPIFRNPVTQMAEQLYVFIEGLCVGVIGPHGRKYIPFILTIWLVIFVSNICGLILPHTITADWSLNLGAALIVVIYVQYEGMLANYHLALSKGKSKPAAVVMGILGHFRHFAGPKLAWYMGLIITPLIFGIELISEAIKIGTLSLRLYGNISGGDIVRNTLDRLVQPIPVGSVTIPLPLGVLVLPLEFLVCIIQALVFTLLSCVYLSLVTAHHEEEHVTRNEAAAAAA